jgi:hypothetical protein
MAIQLKVIAGTEKDRGRTFDLPEQGSVLLGRGPGSDTRLNDVRVSGTHCRIYAERGALTITDNGSTNGTFVNERVLAPDELRDLVPGDMIRLGEQTQIEVVGDDVAVMKTVAGNAGMLARELAAAAAKLPRPAVPPAPPPPPAHPVVPAPAAPRLARSQAGEPTVEVTCACGQQLVAREKYAGTRVRCPACREILQLPGRPALAQPVAEVETAPVPAIRPSGNRLWARVVTAAAAVLLVLAAGACLAALSGGGKSADGSRKAAVGQVRSEAP